MTAKELLREQLLRERVEALSEDDAAKALRLLSDQLGGGNPFPAHLDIVPLSEESFTPEEEALIQEGRDDIRAGRTVSLEEVRAELG